MVLNTILAQFVQYFFKNLFLCVAKMQIHKGY